MWYTSIEPHSISNSYWRGGGLNYHGCEILPMTPLIFIYYWRKGSKSMFFYDRDILNTPSFFISIGEGVKMLWGYILNHSARSNSQWRIGSKYYVSDILNSPPNFISYWRGVSKYHECYINYPSLLLFPIFTGMGFKISWPQYINPSSDVQCTWGGGSK